MMLELQRGLQVCAKKWSSAQRAEPAPPPPQGGGPVSK